MAIFNDFPCVLGTKKDTSVSEASTTQPSLDKMRLPELKDLAKQMGLTGVSAKRKPELIEAKRVR